MTVFDSITYTPPPALITGIIRNSRSLDQHTWICTGFFFFLNKSDVQQCLITYLFRHEFTAAQTASIKNGRPKGKGIRCNCEDRVFLRKYSGGRDTHPHTARLVDLFSWTVHGVCVIRDDATHKPIQASCRKLEPCCDVQINKTCIKVEAVFARDQSHFQRDILI